MLLESFDHLPWHVIERPGDCLTNRITLDRHVILAR
jgi:hypothetical protein